MNVRNLCLGLALILTAPFAASAAPFGLDASAVEDPCAEASVTVERHQATLRSLGHSTLVDLLADRSFRVRSPLPRGEGIAGLLALGFAEPVVLSDDIRLRRDWRFLRQRFVRAVQWTREGNIPEAFASCPEAMRSWRANVVHWERFLGLAAEDQGPAAD